MTVFIIIVICIVVFFLVSDANSKRNEIASDSLLSKGLDKKYPKLIQEIMEDNFTLSENKKSKIDFYKFDDIGNTKLRIDISILYQSGNRIHFICQGYKVYPNKKYLATKNFFFPENLGEDYIIKNFINELYPFIGELKMKAL